MNDLSGFQRDLLYVISGVAQPSGMDVISEIDSYYEEGVNQAMVYDNLDSLVEAGLVRKQHLDGRTKLYSLTTQGETVLESRRAWEDQFVEIGLCK